MCAAPRIRAWLSTVLIAVVSAVMSAAGLGGLAPAGPAPAAEPRCLVIDVFPGNAAAEQPVVEAVAAFAGQRNGVVMVRRFIDTNPADRAEFERLPGRSGCRCSRS